MTLLIDPPNAPGHGRLWSHLASDASFDELHRFAAALGIPQRGFDRDHYDIPAERYDAVVAAGATQVTSRELIERLVRSGLRRRKPVTLAPRPPGRPLVRPRRLRPGDRVSVTSTAGPVATDRFQAGLDVLSSWGLDVVVADHARGRHEDLPHLAAADAARADDFMHAWTDPQVVAVFCGRGGYGTQRILDRLDWAALAAAGPKVLVGFSDVTALHQAMATRLGLATVHGPVVTSIADDDLAQERLRALLFEPETVRELTAGGEVLVPGTAEGVLVGGNLALLAAELGTGFSRPAAGSLAVLEDVDEELYRLDRLLTQLLRAGWFDGVRGIVLGEFTRCGRAESLRRLFEDRLGPLGVPMLAGAPFGHGAHNLPLPLGVPAALDGAGRLTLRQSALR